MSNQEYGNTGLPIFKYHLDPIRSKVIETSDTQCKCCGISRGWIYTGPVYAEQEFYEQLCPWCIADGNANAKFDASFVDDIGIGSGDGWDSVPQSVVDEITKQTPSFAGLQQEQWWTHCGDAAQFVDYAGHDELIEFGTECIEIMKRYWDLESEEDWELMFEAMKKNCSPVAYVFRCLKCGAYGGYWDAD